MLYSDSTAEGPHGNKASLLKQPNTLRMKATAHVQSGQNVSKGLA